MRVFLKTRSAGVGWRRWIASFLVCSPAHSFIRWFACTLARSNLRLLSPSPVSLPSKLVNQEREEKENVNGGRDAK